MREQSWEHSLAFLPLISRENLSDVQELNVEQSRKSTRKLNFFFSLFLVVFIQEL